MKRKTDCPLAWGIELWHENQEGRYRKLYNAATPSRKVALTWNGCPIRVRLVRETQFRAMRHYIRSMENTVTAQEKEIDRLRAEVARLKGTRCQP